MNRLPLDESTDATGEAARRDEADQVRDGGGDGFPGLRVPSRARDPRGVSRRRSSRLIHSSLTVLGLDAAALGCGDTVAFVLNERIKVQSGTLTDEETGLDEEAEPISVHRVHGKPRHRGSSACPSRRHFSLPRLRWHSRGNRLLPPDVRPFDALRLGGQSVPRLRPTTTRFS